jgi:hypothetical protein
MEQRNCFPEVALPQVTFVEHRPMEHLPLKQIDKTDGAHSQPNLYESDFYQWIQQTAGALKAKAFDQVDWDNVIEEIESMGRSERRELKSRLIVLLEHLLKLHPGLLKGPTMNGAGGTPSSSSGGKFNSF